MAAGTPISPRNTLFITGATSGIGKSTARLFARKGWFLGLAARNGQALADFQQELGSENCSIHPMDVTDASQVQTQFNLFAEQTGGRLDVLVNNAGVLKAGHFEDIPLHEHQSIINTNVSGVLNCLHAGFQLLKDTKGARAINMSSASAMYGSPSLASYSASKFAVRGLTEALNLEWARHDITVTDIMPPFVDTDMLEPGVRDRVKAISVLGVQLTPDDVAHAVWDAIHSPRLHQRMTRSFKLLALMQKHSPEVVNRRFVKLLSGY